MPIFKQIQLKSKNVKANYLYFWEHYTEEIESAIYQSADKEERKDKLKSLKAKVMKDLQAYLVEREETTKNELFELVAEGVSVLDNKSLESSFDEVLTQIIQRNLLEKNQRIDSRNLNETRKISCQVNVLPKTHASSLFQRGETQVLNVLTIGTLREAQTLDDMENTEEDSKRYMHHYNFPSYSVGEVGRYSGASRREIGHGALAEKALLPVIPSQEEFPYTLRLVSECLGSNGSTSMASTCASTLSLLQGGVPIKENIGGVAMGLIIEKKSKKIETLQKNIQELENILSGL